MKDSRGSIWRKWDLHLHTPASGNDYENQSITNKTIIQKLKDANIAAVAITDHFVMDVDRIVDLQSIAGEDITVFPGIELRSELGGNESIHYIGIFPDRLDIQKLRDIWDELKAKCELTPTRIAERGGINAITCDLDQTCKLIHLLGGIVTIHSGSKTNSIENIANTEYFKMIQKKEIVANSVDIMELGKANDEEIHKEIIFKSIGFSLPLIICSDNHNITDYTLKAPCWIKADATFQGLKQIIIEHKDRVFIGDEPDILKRVRGNKTKYIHSFAIKKEEGAIFDEIWFSENPEIVINPGLVSIIGNKGSGKSSIADTLGLLGNTQQSSHFSFLNPTKFRDKRDNKAKHFKAKMKWESGDAIEKNLNDDIDGNSAEMIKCIPQNYLEKICTEQLEGSLFNEELKKVIYSHVSDTVKLDFDTLDALMEYKTTEKSQSIEIAKTELFKINLTISLLEGRQHPDYKSGLQNKLRTKQQEKASHETIKPPDKTKPQIGEQEQQKIEQITNEINIKQQNIQQLQKETIALREEGKTKYENYTNAKKLLEKIDNFQKEYATFKHECEELANKLSVDISDIINLEIKKNSIEAIKTKSWDKYSETSTKLKEDCVDGPLYKKKLLEKEVETLQSTLDKPNKDYQNYLIEKAKWEEKLKLIIGDASTPDTIKYYEQQIKEIDNIPEQLKHTKENRLSKIKEVFSQLCQLRDEYGTLYKPVKDFVGSQKFAKERFSMDFRVSIICEGFVDNFFDFIAQNKKGSFYESDKGRKKLKDILDSSDFDSIQGLGKFLQQIEENLNTDQRDDSKGEVRYVNDQLRQGVLVQNFYNYIYSLDYLKPKYILRWAGKDLSQLSPGERGTVLLIFYLFISRDETPLVIDQPEENLDNETIYGVLVPCIKEAKKRRQIIIVTHNPNLAVVCDADQIIHCEMKKNKKNKITYISGAIENPLINKALIDILEGTRPAFNNRDFKYYAE